MFQLYKSPSLKRVNKYLEDLSIVTNWEQTFSTRLCEFSHWICKNIIYSCKSVQDHKSHCFLEWRGFLILTWSVRIVYNITFVHIASLYYCISLEYRLVSEFKQHSWKKNSKGTAGAINGWKNIQQATKHGYAANMLLHLGSII